MNEPKQLRAPAKLLAGFVLLSAVPLATLGWLGWTFFEQDRALEAQRLREQLENAAAVTARDLEEALATWERLLSSIEGANPSDLPGGSAFIVFDSQGIHKRQGISLPYYPYVPARAEAPRPVFASAEALELNENNLAGAASVYRTLADSGDKRIRASALMRLARCLRKDGKLRESIDVYGELETLQDLSVSGSPAALVAHRERIALFKSLGDLEAASRETKVLASVLGEGRYFIDHATWDFFAESLDDPPVESRATKLASAIHRLWPQRGIRHSGEACLSTECSADASLCCRHIDLIPRSPAGSR